MTESVRLLHVEDDPEFAELTAELLQREDSRLSVATAASAEAGLDRLAEESFDCIVSDYEMPGRNGLEFLEAVRERNSDVPFILYTGKGSETVASDAISAGVTDYLQKEGSADQYTILANRITNAVSAREAATTADRTRRRLEQILKTVPECIVQLNYEGEFTFANERAVEVLGLEESAITDRAYNDPEWEIRDMDRNPIPDEALPFRQVRDSGEPVYDYRHTVVWPDGNRKVLAVNGAPLFDDEGTVENVVFALSDITERREQETDLKRTTARLEALFENSPDMIDVHDAEGRLLEVNSRLCEETGYDASELRGMRVWDLDTTVEPDAERAPWTEMAVGERREHEGVYRRRDGSTFPVEVHVRRIDSDDGGRFVVITRNVSAQREREAEIDSKERRLQRQLDQFEQFSSVLSHDLQTPLQTVEGRLALARETGELEHLDHAEVALDRLAGLIDELATVMRQGELVDDPTPQDIETVVREAWAPLPTDGVDLVVAETAQVRADGRAFTRLLENLLKNALDHGGETVTVGRLPDGFYLEDDGPGIPEDVRQEVFDPGYSTKAETDGTGFGLTSTHQIALAHGWTIAAVDGDGGARFEVTGVEFVE